MRKRDLSLSIQIKKLSFSLSPCFSFNLLVFSFIQFSPLLIPFFSLSLSFFHFTHSKKLINMFLLLTFCLWIIISCESFWWTWCVFQCRNHFDFYFLPYSHYLFLSPTFLSLLISLSFFLFLPHFLSHSLSLLLHEPFLLSHQFRAHETRTKLNTRWSPCPSIL